MAGVIAGMLAITPVAARFTQNPVKMPSSLRRQRKPDESYESHE